MASSSSLLSQPWVPVSVQDSRFLCRSWFGSTQYQLLLMDSECLWEESVEEQQVQARAQELNRRLRASTHSFFTRLVTVVTPWLTGSGCDHMTMRREDGHMTLRLRTEVGGVPFTWEFHLRPASVSVACVQLVRPLLVMGAVLQQQVASLFKQLQQKDAEIQDYRENGAQLSRERLQTEAFEEDSFRHDFITKTLPQLVDPDSPLDLDSDLQQLLSCIQTRLDPNKLKRRRSEEPNLDSEEEERRREEEERKTEEEKNGQAPETGASEVQREETPVKKTTRPIMQQQGSSSSSSSQAAPKPKKKKVGLFR